MLPAYVIACAKNVFRKSPKNRHFFKTFAPTLPMPPRPVPTRWGTWSTAATYWSENLEVFAETVYQIPGQSEALTNVRAIL